MSQNTFKLVTDYPVTEYGCGIRAGQQVRLKVDLVIKDHRGRSVGMHLHGEVWTVLCGAAEEPAVVWLRQADGETHTWSDDEEFWQTFVRQSINTRLNTTRFTMPDDNSSESLLQRLCELQEKQLVAMEKLSDHLTQAAADGQKNHDLYAAQSAANEQYRLRHQKSALITGALMITMLGLIVAAILITHFF